MKTRDKNIESEEVVEGGEALFVGEATEIEKAEESKGNEEVIAGLNKISEALSLIEEWCLLRMMKENNAEIIAKLKEKENEEQKEIYNKKSSSVKEFIKNAIDKNIESEEVVEGGEALYVGETMEIENAQESKGNEEVIAGVDEISGAFSLIEEWASLRIMKENNVETIAKLKEKENEKQREIYNQNVQAFKEQKEIFVQGGYLKDKNESPIALSFVRNSLFKPKLTQEIFSFLTPEPLKLSYPELNRG